MAMRLYLSSYRIPVPEALMVLAERPQQFTRMAIIPNAQDYYAPRPRSVKIAEVAEYMHDLGYKVEIVDLNDYKEPTPLQQTLQTYDVLWVMGGNTFCLRQAMQRSGFDMIIKSLLSDGIV